MLLEELVNKIYSESNIQDSGVVQTLIENYKESLWTNHISAIARRFYISEY
jgi:hypothetical protein